MRQTSKALLCAGLLPAQERRILFFVKGMQSRLKLFNHSDDLRLQKSIVAPAQAGARSEAALQFYAKQR